MVEDITQKIPYTPEKNLAKENISNVGIGLFIVDLESKKIWVIEELVDKNSTGRKSGKVSIPMETRKKGETIVENVLGGFSEFRELQNGEELIWVNNRVSYKGRYPFVKGCVADVVMVGLKNIKRESDLSSHLKSSEVSSMGWKDIDEILKIPNLRDGVKEYLKLAKREHWIDKFVIEVNSGNEKQYVCKKGEKTLEYLKIREEKPDFSN